MGSGVDVELSRIRGSGGDKGNTGTCRADFWERHSEPLSETGIHFPELDRGGRSNVVLSPGEKPKQAGHITKRAYRRLIRGLCRGILENRMVR